MIIDIPYDNGILKCDFPSQTKIIEAQSREAIGEIEIRERFFGSFNRFRVENKSEKFLVVVNDATRRVPNEKIIELILESVEPGQLEFIVATGSHKAPSEDELKKILGKYYRIFSEHVSIHDCNDGEALQFAGTTSRGTPVIVSKRVLDATAIICINSVEPHFFAGFTGGRKSIIPGLAGLQTIVKNHSLAKSGDAESMKLELNPVHMDLLDAIKLVNKSEIFSVQMLVSKQNQIIDIECGQLEKSFENICNIARFFYGAVIDEHFDVVFAIAEEPLDINLYQLQKAQEHGAKAVRDGGILVVVGACNEGVGSSFFLKLAEEYPLPEAALSDRALTDERFGIHKLVRTARMLERIRIRYVTKVDDNLVRKVYFEPQASIGEAIREARNILGDACKVAVLMDACYTVPILK